MPNAKRNKVVDAFLKSIPDMSLTSSRWKIANHSLYFKDTFMAEYNLNTLSIERVPRHKIEMLFPDESSTKSAIIRNMEAMDLFDVLDPSGKPAATSLTYANAIKVKKSLKKEGLVIAKSPY